MPGPLDELKKLLGGIAAQPARKHAPASPVRIGIAGRGPIMEETARAYSGLPHTAPPVLFCPGDAGELSAFIENIDAAEVIAPPDEHRDALILALLRAGKHVSINKPFATTAAQAQSIIDASRRSVAHIRINEPAIFHPTYMKLRELIRDMEIGELCGVRIRSNLCGKGGAGAMTKLMSPHFLHHPAFDNFALACWLAGPAESVYCCTQGISTKKGGGAIAAIRHTAPGCYTHLDISFSPAAEIRSDCIPCDDTIEAAGTDGIIWARHFHGKMTEEPNIEVRRGKKHYTIGIASGLKFDWRDTLRASAADFIRCIREDKQPALAPEDSLHALKTLLAARESAETHAEVKA